MIKSISYLVSEEVRERVPCVSGKFHLKRKPQKASLRPKRSSQSTKTFSAKEFVNFVRHRDPYVTLESGEKLRVYRGGDPTDEVIETISLIESHDEKHNTYSLPDYEGLLDYGW